MIALEVPAANPCWKAYIGLMMGWVSAGEITSGGSCSQIGQKFRWQYGMYFDKNK